jgi:Na+-translocating ferredoxin:NAD+ oxidoreductase RnfC subunit
MTGVREQGNFWAPVGKTGAKVLPRKTYFQDGADHILLKVLRDGDLVTNLDVPCGNRIINCLFLTCRALWAVPAP